MKLKILNLKKICIIIIVIYSMEKPKTENSLIKIFQKMLLSDDNLIDLSMEEIEKLKEFEENNMNNNKINSKFNDRIYCELCNHDYRIDNYNKHLKSKKHLKKAILN
jgi:hypothetical protein